ncbi:MAG TPA: serine hydrolase domain-containing protein, partial [Candidatus Limnocylindrales bacterium]
RFRDGSVWVGTDGLADAATKTPVTADTAFAIASISKTFTAALILALAEDGELFLDSPVGSILPDLDIDPDITIRQLLDHTSGLHDFFFHPSIDAALLRERDRRWEMADSLRYVGEPYFEPGQGWHYSNTNYLVLGAVAETVGEGSLAEQLRERFFVPLGLHATWYQPQEQPLAPVSVGYRFAGTGVEAPPISLADGTATMPFSSVVTAAAGAGGVASSAADLVRWARALYGGDVLEPVTVEAMLEDVTRTAVYAPGVPYGLGVQRTVIDGHDALGHSGRLLGYRSVVRWLPGPDVTVAVLSNQSREDPGNVARVLLRAAIGPTDPCDCAERR